MKKVLIITYYWPPSGGAGVQRWLKFVKYLRQFGWEPVVFTPENPEFPSIDNSLEQDIPEGVEVITNKIWEPYQFYKKFTGKSKKDKIQSGFLSEKNNRFEILEQFAIWLRGNLFIPDARRFWIKPSVKYLSKYLKNNPVDLIVSTGPPHSAHLIALKLNKKLGVRWIADFRDPWTNIDFYHDLKLSRWADKVHHSMEKRVLKNADSVVVISRGMKNDFSSIHHRKYDVIPNGYDLEDINKIEAKPSADKKFVLAHIGSLNKDRNPVNLWQAIGELVKENEEFARYLEIKNVGKIDIKAIESVKKFGIEQYLKRIDYLSHQKVIAQQQSSTLLLLLVNRTPNAKLIVTGKIFEYLISGRPILCIGPTDGDAASIVNETNCGNVFAFDEVNMLKNYLIKAFEMHKNGMLKTDCHNVEQYSRENLTKRLTDLFNSVI